VLELRRKGIEPRAIGERVGLGTAQVYDVLKRARLRQNYDEGENGERGDD